MWKGDNVYIHVYKHLLFFVINTLIKTFIFFKRLLTPRLACAVFFCWLFFVIDSVCLDVCMSVTANFKSLLLFCFSTESSHFAPSVLHVALYKTVFFDFWFRPPNPQNLQLHKIACNSACMTDRPEMFAPTRGFSWTPISRLVYQIDQICLGLPGETTTGADRCCHGNDICAIHGV